MVDITESNRTVIYVKSSNELRTIRYSSQNKPEVPQEMFDKWQQLINSIIKLADVKAALINQLSDGHAKVLLKSQNPDNPYTVGATGKLCLGTYCEEVMGTNRALNVEDANVDPVWSDSIYIKHQIISYYGLPLLWPDGDFFGTICVLDTKPHVFSDEFIRVFESIKLSIEHDLGQLFRHRELYELAYFDALTEVFNKRGIFEQLQAFDGLSKSQGTPYSMIMMDLDFFKEINDRHGHVFGDVVLKGFAKALKQNCLEDQIVGRFGGDEFIILVPNSTYDQTRLWMEHMAEALKATRIADGIEWSFSYGIACSEAFHDITSMIVFADQALYRMKQKHHQQRAALRAQN